MTLKELKTKYYIYKSHNDDGNYRICSLTDHGRFPHKYLCSAIKSGNKMSVLGYKLTSKLEEFEKQVEDYLSKLEFDSEYFNPDLREGYKYEMYVYDYMNSLGFKNKDRSNYVYNPNDIYGGKSVKISVSFYGLEIREEKEELSMSLHRDNFSWVSIKLEKDLLKIKEGIDSLLKPLFLSESLSFFKLSENMGYIETDLKFKVLEDFNIKTQDYKETLKQKLKEILEKLC